MQIRPARDRDTPAIWRAIEPVFRAGETYPLAREVSERDALAYWFAPGHEVFVARNGDDPGDDIVGSYYLRANTGGGGAHVANCGYITAPAARRRGVARAMCRHSLVRARERGFRAMQFNFVISTNQPAVGLWQSCGFAIVGRLPRAFAHPTLGYVDALVMFQEL